VECREDIPQYTLPSHRNPDCILRVNILK
jgi:hypothetical protein